MKLLTLNTWGGKLYQPLMTFIGRLCGQVDVFCFQEVFDSHSGIIESSGARMTLLQDLVDALPGYRLLYARKSSGYDYSGVVDFQVNFGNAVFVKDGLEVLSSEELFEAIDHPYHNWLDDAIGKAQLVQIKTPEDTYTICNFHGIWINGTGKRDTPERIAQSEYLLKALSQYSGKKILAGDFNLVPDGESFRILNDGMREW